jgi:predicted SnoaL-like aldol condensation-catalyzing enzyme
MQIAQDFIDGMNSGGDGIEELIHEKGLRQHNPTIGDGFDGLAAALDSCHGRYPSFEVLIGFEAEPYVVLICTREVSGFHLGIEVFQITEGKIRAHWDNYCHTSHRLVDGLRAGVVELREVSQKIIEPLSNAAAGRVVNDFVSDVLIGCDLATGWHLSPVGYKEWKSEAGMFLDRPREQFMKEYGFRLPFNYSKTHKVITNGRFALAVIEGVAAGHSTCHFEFFALDRLGIYFRLPIDELVILPEFRRHSNGKFSFSV